MNIFRSIRWRLVTSYVLLTLLTVGMVGVLALEMMRRYAYQQELNELQANAQAIASQAEKLLWPSVRQSELERLAQTASFLSDVRVRILDRQGTALVDTGQPGAASQMIWVVPPEEDGLLPGLLPGWISMMVVPDPEVPRWPDIRLSLLEELPNGTSVTIVRRNESLWGSRITFEYPSYEVSGQPPHLITPSGEEISAAGSPDTPSPLNSIPRSQSLLTEPVYYEDSLLGFVELSAGPSFAGEAQNAARQALIVAGVGATLLAGILGLVISHRLTSPLRSLQEVAGRMGAGDLSARASIQSQDEIGDVAAGFNQMAGSLQEMFEQLAAERDALRRFVADASHELRTPVTALKNFNTLLLGAAAGDPEAQAEFLTESQAQIERLEWITTNLIDLSRTDARLDNLNRSLVEVNDLLESAAAPYIPLAREQGKILRVLPMPEPAELNVDRARMEMALENLLDNALKFTPAGGQIEIGGERQGKRVRLWVCDDGPGIHPDDLPHVFARFYRGRSLGLPGSGLGLAIVESIVRGHGGQVTAESQLGKGACFSIFL